MASDSDSDGSVEGESHESDISEGSGQGESDASDSCEYSEEGELDDSSTSEEVSPQSESDDSSTSEEMSSKSVSKWVDHISGVSPLQRLRRLRILLPCAGWDAPTQALHALGIQHEMVGAWDVSRSAGSVLKRLHTGVPKKCLHLGSDGDICSVRLQDLPDAECLISGPPCPPFSTIGVNRGWQDPRSKVFHCVVRWILHLAKQSLVCFVLENVKGMMHKQRGKTTKRGGQSPAEEVMTRLRKQLTGWHIELLVCNSRCTAQSRERIYIVGYRLTEGAHAHTHVVSDALQALPPSSIGSILQSALPNTELSSLSVSQRSNLNKYKHLLRAKLRDPEMQGQFAVFHVDRDPDKAFGSQVRVDGLVPCLRASHDRVFIMSLGKRRPNVQRLVHPSEACRLQGMSPSIVCRGMSRRAIFRGCGNAMTVPVVGTVLVATLQKSLPALDKMLLESRSDSSSSSSECSDD